MMYFTRFPDGNLPFMRIIVFNFSYVKLFTLKQIKAFLIKPFRNTDRKVRTIFQYSFNTPVMIKMLMGLEQHVYFMVGKHLIDAFPLIAFIHPRCVPAAVKQNFLL